MANTKGLGSTQKSLIRCLIEHGSWHDGNWGCGWVWSTPAGTKRILDGLVKRDLVKRTEVNGYNLYHLNITEEEAKCLVRKG